MSGDQCYVGSLGRMVALPDVAATTTVALTHVGGMHRSLRGTLQVDTFTRKRAWTWTYAGLLEEQTAYLDALQEGVVRGPLRLIDPRRLNRLPQDAAGGGSASGSNTAFGTTAGSVTYYHPMSALAGTNPDETLGPVSLVKGAQEWNLLAVGADNNVMSPVDHRYIDRTWRVPLLPDEQIVVSCWVSGPSSASCWLMVQWFDRDGNRLNGDLTFTPVTLPNEPPVAPDHWTKLTGTLTVPEGAASVNPLLYTNDTYAIDGTSFYTTAWSVGSALGVPEPVGITRHCEPYSGDDFRTGGGGPYVVPETTGLGYSSPGFYDATFTLYET